MAQVFPFFTPFNKRHRLRGVTRHFILDSSFQHRSQQSFRAHTCPLGTGPGIHQSSPAGGLSQSQCRSSTMRPSEDNRDFREGGGKVGSLMVLLLPEPLDC